MIDVHPDSGIAVLRLDHGWVNAMDAELYQAVTRQCEAVAEGPARALVLTGAGSAFSAGSDLRLLLGGGPAYVEEFFPALAGMLGTFFPVPKPVVVAVNGTPSPAVVCSPRPRMSR